MNTITAPGWHYGDVHAPTSPTTPRPRPSSPSSSRPLRRLLSAVAVTALAATGGALTACSPEPPEPDEAMVSLAGQLNSLDGSDVAGGTALFADQAAAVNEEILRQCGTDRDGNGSPACEDAVAGDGGSDAESDADSDGGGTPTVAEIRDGMMDMIRYAGGKGDGQYATAPDADGARDRAVLLTGLHAALATVEDSDAGGPAIDRDLLEDGFPGSGGTDGDDSSVSSETAEALAPATELVDEAVYLAGVVLPVAGTNRDTVMTVSERLREIRDAVASVSGVAADPGYTLPDGQDSPTDAPSAVATLLPAVHAVTVALRGAVDDVDASDRPVVAMWCAVAARSEAALEDAAGTDPLETSIRGQ